MTKHILGTIQSGPDPGELSRKHHELDLAVELTVDEYAELSTAQKILNRFLQDSQLFMIVAWNFNEFMDLISTYIHAYANKEFELFETKPININLNRTFLNLLASMRSYLDFMDRHLKSRFGNDSEIVVNFAKACSQEYDDSFSYRFIYRLRNYAQHKGFPIGRFSWGQRPSRSNPKEPEIFMEILIARDEIIDDFNWGPLASEVQGLPEFIDVAPLAKSFMDSLSSIHLQVIRSLFQTLEDSARQVITFGRRIADKPGQPVIFEVKDGIEIFRDISHRPLMLDLAHRIVDGHLENVIRHPGQDAG